MQALLLAASTATATVAARLGDATAAMAAWQLQATPDDPQIVYPVEVREVLAVLPMPSWADRACTFAPNSSAIPRFSSFGFRNGACGPCPQGTEARFDALQQRRLCSSCAAGRTFRWLSANESRCELRCPPGQVQDMAEQCKPCFAGYFSENSLLGEVCSQCALGETSWDLAV